MARIGRYQPIMLLGQGGMADVLLAVGRGPAGFNKLVVLKSMRGDFAEDAELREMFLAEARISARLSHANVVHVYEVLDQQEQSCIVMEYLDGQTMSDVQKAAGGSFTAEMQLRVISDVLAGLHYSHELCDYDGSPLNLVHRDVSPQNVFITYDGQVKVLDFGIAKVASAPGHTRTGIVKGKISYMAPEQLLGGHLDRRADVYAVGTMAWQAVAGEKLWQGMSEGEIARALVSGKIPAPSTKRPVDPKLEAIVMTALSLSPDARFSSALEFQAALDECLAGRSQSRVTRDVGGFVAKLFVEQRRARARVIHEALSTPAVGDEMTGTLMEVRAGDVEKSGTGSTAFKASLAGDARVEPRRRPAILATTGVVLVLVLVAGAWGSYRLWRGSGPSTSAVTDTAKPGLVSLSISVRPRDARITVDGTPVDGNPTVASVVADGAMHEIRAEREGYVPFVRRMRIERSVSLETDLRRQVAENPSAPAQPSTGRARVAPRSAPRHARGVRRSAESSGSAQSVTESSLSEQSSAESSLSAAPPAPRVEDMPAHADTASCNPPFYLQGGIKVYKPGCI